MNSEPPRSQGPVRILRGLLILCTAGVFLVCTAMFSALPGFGYRTPRVASGDFRESPSRAGGGAGGGVGRDRSATAHNIDARHPVSVVLYYPRADLPYALSPLEVVLDDEGDLGSMLNQVVHALTRPPEGAGLTAALPTDTKLLTFFRNGDLVLVNLSPNVQQHSPGGLVASHASLYALVNSITSLAGIDRVRFFVSNQESLTLREGHSLDRDYRFFAGAVRPLAPVPSGSP